MWHFIANDIPGYILLTTHPKAHYLNENRRDKIVECAITISVLSLQPTGYILNNGRLSI